RDTGESALVSRSFQSPAEAGSSPAHRWVTGALSADGGTVAFTSTATNLVDGDRNCLADAFLYDNGRIGHFYTLPPCRFLDTRLPQDGPALASGQTALLHLYNTCGIPETAKAVAVNVTAVGATGQGHVAFYRGDAVAAPGTSTLSFRPGLTRASFAILPLAANADGSLKVVPSVTGGGTVHVLIDVAGYFE
ncbi:MAG TPA: hypothetical protein VEL74_00525, partial [Thermoanaerobaculia bacterium]|nr:hypothetical protein [Thermoanaerobaculia bacterium]